MAEETTKRGTAVRDFRDAGSEKLFEKGKSYTLSEGVFGNYQHAGLVIEADASAEVADPVSAPAPTGDA